MSSFPVNCEMNEFQAIFIILHKIVQQYSNSYHSYCNFKQMKFTCFQYFSCILAQKFIGVNRAKMFISIKNKGVIHHKIKPVADIASASACHHT